MVLRECLVVTLHLLDKNINFLPGKANLDSALVYKRAISDVDHTAFKLNERSWFDWP